MADPLKDLIDASVVHTLGDDLSASARRLGAPFDRAGFVRNATRGLEQHELLARGRHVARAMRSHLPPETERAIAVVVGALGPRLGGARSMVTPADEAGAERAASGERDAGAMGLSVFRWLPVSAFLEAHGTDAWDAGLAACRELTQRFTAEFCIRPFLEARPSDAFAVLAHWCDDENEHVRRLCSEGTRTRLPWGPRLRIAIAEPERVLPLLEKLKDDRSEYVRRSVANNLNDLSKDHPARVLEVCSRWWSGGSAQRRKLVKHALRSLIKKGDRDALHLVGMDVDRSHASFEVTGRVRPARARIGDTVQVEVSVHNTGPATARAVVDVVVHYIKASGASSPKVFKGRTLELAADERSSFTHKLAFVDRSIRKHFPGVHRIEAKVNGRLVPVGTVKLAAQAKRRA